MVGIESITWCWRKQRSGGGEGGGGGGEEVGEGLWRKGRRGRPDTEKRGERKKGNDGEG